jgi:hypothetical protein
MKMYADCRSFWLPKADRSAEEYEDAFYPKSDIEHSLDRAMRFAVADGATESSFARRWAKQLVIAYCHPETPRPADMAGFRAQIERCGADWSSYVSAKPLAWNFLAKAQRGAFATLAGVTLMPGTDEVGCWEAVAVGDSCLFQVRDSKLERAFPSQQSNVFGFHPELLCSLSKMNEPVWAAWNEHLETGEWSSGDQFLLMTDALAKWFVESLEMAGRPWEILQEVTSTHGHFATWVQRQREGRTMTNDDVTLMLIAIRAGT